MIKLTELTPEQIGYALGLKPFQGKQIFRWIYQKQVFDIDAMTDLPKALRNTMKECCTVSQLQRVTETVSTSGAKKLLFRLKDGETVESVLLRDSERVTLCLSTQVGCPVRCAFCATGLSGYVRNLTAGEIVEQALGLLAGENMEDRSPNIVYMGMGEPFLNYDASIQSIRLLMRTDGLGIGARKITISTVGDVPGILRFAEEQWQVRLSVSLHAANDALRAQLVPLARQYPIKVLMPALREYLKATGRQVTFEWVLLDGLNDSDRDAGELADLIRGMKAGVNLIPYNAVPGLPYAAPSRMRCEAFRDILLKKGYQVTLRRERGQDINAACGQLRRQAASE